MTTESLLLANCLRKNIFFSLSRGGGSSDYSLCVSPLYTRSSSSVCSELSPCHDNYIHYVMVSCILNDWSHTPLHALELDKELREVRGY